MDDCQILSTVQPYSLLFIISLSTLFWQLVLCPAHKITQECYVNLCQHVSTACMSVVDSLTHA